jgi:hypothetical protein
METKTTDRLNCSCACCDVLPLSQPEARQMRSTGLCNECEGEARLKGWKPENGLSDALKALLDNGWQEKIKNRRMSVQT